MNLGVRKSNLFGTIKPSEYKQIKTAMQNEKICMASARQYRICQLNVGGALVAWSRPLRRLTTAPRVRIPLLARTSGAAYS
jgi:hypothetical protein